MLLLGGQIIASLLIAYGDFKERKILLWVLLLLFVVNLSCTFLSVGGYLMVQITAINTLVVSSIFFLTYLYLKKIKKIEKPAETHLGIGDWLFFIAVTPLFLPQVYIYVFLSMNIFTLLIGIIITLIKKGKWEIPYAGISALLFVILCIMQYLSPIEILTLI